MGNLQLSPVDRKRTGPEKMTGAKSKRNKSKGGGHSVPPLCERRQLFLRIFSEKRRRKQGELTERTGSVEGASLRFFAGSQGGASKNR